MIFPRVTEKRSTSLPERIERLVVAVVQNLFLEEALATLCTQAQFC
jgi:hypothetical protein